MALKYKVECIHCNSVFMQVCAHEEYYKPDAERSVDEDPSFDEVQCNHIRRLNLPYNTSSYTDACFTNTEADTIKNVCPREVSAREKRASERQACNQVSIGQSICKCSLQR